MTEPTQHHLDPRYLARKASERSCVAGHPWATQGGSDPTLRSALTRSYRLGDGRLSAQAETPGPSAPARATMPGYPLSDRTAVGDSDEQPRPGHRGWLISHRAAARRLPADDPSEPAQLAEPTHRPVAYQHRHGLLHLRHRRAQTQLPAPATQRDRQVSGLVSSVSTPGDRPSVSQPLRQSDAFVGTSQRRGPCSGRMEQG